MDEQYRAVGPPAQRLEAAHDRDHLALGVLVACVEPVERVDDDEIGPVPQHVPLEGQELVVHVLIGLAPGEDLKAGADRYPEVLVAGP